MYIYIYIDGCRTHKNIIKVTSKSYLEHACVLHVVVLKQRKETPRKNVCACVETKKMARNLNAKLLLLLLLLLFKQNMAI